MTSKSFAGLGNLSRVNFLCPLILIALLNSSRTLAKILNSQISFLGKMAFRRFYHVRPGCRFRPTHGLGFPGEALRRWFNRNTDVARVMWVLLCRNSPTEWCWPSVPKAQTVDYRRRRHGGTRSATRRVRLGSGMEAAWAGCLERPDAIRARSWAVSAPKVRCAATRSRCKRVKGGTVRGGDKGRRV
jgi:hypothetical protein